jgi:NAD(P)-dependent dehydrogenase (short-subunit alcohol dehydrogenase family)
MKVLGMSKWGTGDIPSQCGRVAVITGANTGLGYQTAAALAARGAHVVLAVRDLDKGNDAAARIAATSPRASVTVQQLDLTSLASVHAAANKLKRAYAAIDLLINNAGVTLVEGHTKDGFELQFGVNYLAHFALTGLLLDHLLAVDGSRVVTISSLGHHVRGDVDFDDLHGEHDYHPGVAYGRSKLANLLFTYELQRRFASSDATTIAVAAHPGFSKTELLRDANFGIRKFFTAISQSPQQGALSPLRAATDPGVIGGEYYGPGGLGELRGHPKVVRSSALSHDEGLQGRLWEVSEKLTGVAFPV